MKKYIFAAIALAFWGTQFTYATSIVDGGDKQSAREVATPGVPAQQDAAQATAAWTDDQMQAMTAPADAETAPATEVTTLKAAAEATTIATESAAPDVKITGTPRAVKRALAKRDGVSQKHEGGRAIGAVSLVFGILGFLVGWILWPIGLAFALLAIVFGIFGMVTGRGVGMSIAGFILGLLTIILPVLIVALLIAALV